MSNIVSLIDSLTLPTTRYQLTGGVKVFDKDKKSKAEKEQLREMKWGWLAGTKPPKNKDKDKSSGFC